MTAGSAWSAVWAGCAAAVLCAVHVPAHAEGFSFEVSDPDFKVSIPAVPKLEMNVHPEHGDKPHYRYLGSDGPFSVTILTPKSDPEMSVEQCAEAIYTALADRPGVPEPDKIYRARMDESTFVAIYATVLPGFVLLHAHFLSAGRGDYCIEVHASKSSTSRDDAQEWFTALSGAKIELR
jgi:hypothetical protein